MGKCKTKSEKKAERAARKAHGAGQKAPTARRSERLSARPVAKATKLRGRRQYDHEQWSLPAPTHLVAKLDLPKPQSKYHTYFEFAENTEKKKKLEFQVTNERRPPPGFEFVPFGDPTLTSACKELSREQDAMIFIVSVRFPWLIVSLVIINTVARTRENTAPRFPIMSIVWATIFAVLSSMRLAD